MAIDKNYWRKIESVINKALSIENAKERKLAVKKACGDNQKLYRDVTFLLECIREAEKQGYLEVD
jgi:hypothetical protein